MEKEKMKKLKLLLSMSMLCLSFAVLCFGVLAATSVKYTIGGTISYEVTDVMVEIETKVFRSSTKTIIDCEALETNAKALEGKTFSEIGSIYTLVKDSTTTGESDKIPVFVTEAEFTTEQATKTVEGIEIKYNDGYQWYIVINIRSLTPSKSAYAKVGSSVLGDDNSYVYNTSYQNDIIKPESGDNIGKNIVLAYGLKDQTVGISDVTFNYSISVVYGTYSDTLEGFGFEIDQTNKTLKLLNYNNSEITDVIIPKKVDLTIIKTTYNTLADYNAAKANNDVNVALCNYGFATLTYGSSSTEAKCITKTAIENILNTSSNYPVTIDHGFSFTSTEATSSTSALTDFQAKLGAMIDAKCGFVVDWDISSMSSALFLLGGLKLHVGVSSWNALKQLSDWMGKIAQKGGSEGLLGTLPFTVSDVYQIDSFGSSGDYTITEIDNLMFDVVDYGCSSTFETIVIPNTITTLNEYQFRGIGCDVYCEAESKPSGWSEGWDSGINHGSEDQDGKVYWYRETKPSETGNFWHYVNGIATKW